jgi:hypothetical protein
MWMLFYFGKTQVFGIVCYAIQFASRDNWFIYCSVRYGFVSLFLDVFINIWFLQIVMKNKKWLRALSWISLITYKIKKYRVVSSYFLHDIQNFRDNFDTFY